MARPPITVVETPQFIRQSDGLWTDAERMEFIDFLARHPETGDVIPGAGGVRKIRWRRQGMGKRGGSRVIYFYHSPAVPLYLLMVYAKAVRENVAPEAVKPLADFAARIKRAARLQGVSADDEQVQS